ncbi:MAG: twin-arginine translocation signal domain-containing protein [Planctomycetota bacterium]
MCCGHLNRRDFLTLTSAAMAGAGLSSPSMNPGMGNR